MPLTSLGQDPLFIISANNLSNTVGNPTEETKMTFLSIKALLGAAVVIIINLAAHMKNYYLAGLVPLFPTFALIAHYIVRSERTHDELKNTILFSLCG